MVRIKVRVETAGLVAVPQQPLEALGQTQVLSVVNFVLKFGEKFRYLCYFCIVYYTVVFLVANKCFFSAGGLVFVVKNNNVLLTSHPVPSHPKFYA